MKLTAYVGKVDMNGYCGRSPHPEPSMEGRWLPVVKAEVQNLGDDENPYTDYVITVRVPASVLTEMSEDDRTLVGPDGKRYLDIELLPHEIRELRTAFEDEPEIQALEPVTR